MALRSRADRLVVGGLGALMLILCVFYVREPFPLLFCIGGGSLALICARFLNEDINDLLLRLIGLSSMIYVPYDIFSDTLARSHIGRMRASLLKCIGARQSCGGVCG